MAALEPAIAVTAAATSSSSCLRNFSHSALTPKAGNFVCQAQPTPERSLILDKQSSLYNVIYLSQQGELLDKTGFSSRIGNGGLSEKASLLQAKEDCYDGVIIDPHSLPINMEEFVASLRLSLSHWKVQGKRGVWLQLPSRLAEYVPVVVKEGFQYHHAEPQYIMMTHWIPDSPCTLPPNASHQVGIGAFVMNENREVLAVQEKNGPLRGSGVWKMPTGLINQGEDLCCGAVREVKEETGVETEFLQVVSFRHGHHVSFSKSDLYFTCVLRPLSCNIILQDNEIEAAKWIPLQEFQSQSFFRESNARQKMLELCVACFDGEYTGFKARKLHSSSLAQPTQYFFHQ
ncbi:hypothetical protein GOP47_0013618 [Adiantum capillus-veneris]|uniref:Nudix hydrolase domain-containing protein n=1 Tax=Adiantum capillus-veneris TaxID=13818 RepID=A0A9D4UPU3_ADICA|nr:hypothetical protein GOP47_0013618 [Adiantum capillus-veneris]